MVKPEDVKAGEFYQYEWNDDPYIAGAHYFFLEVYLVDILGGVGFWEKIKPLKVPLFRKEIGNITPITDPDLIDLLKIIQAKAILAGTWPK